MTIAIPNNQGECEWIKIDPTCLEHKVYPTCFCGKKYVPLKEDPSKCFFCQITDRKPIKIIYPKEIVAKCAICGKIEPRNTKKKHIICYACWSARKAKYKSAKYKSLK